MRLYNLFDCAKRFLCQGIFGQATSIEEFLNYTNGEIGVRGGIIYRFFFSEESPVVIQFSALHNNEIYPLFHDKLVYLKALSEYGKNGSSILRNGKVINPSEFNSGLEFAVRKEADFIEKYNRKTVVKSSFKD